MKILHIITGLGDGGAEHTLYKTCKYDIKNKHIVISLKGPDKYFSLLNKIGIKVFCFNFKYYSIFEFFFLINTIRKLKPDVTQTWLVHADLIGGMASILAGYKKIIWNIRYSNFELGKAKLMTILIIKLLSKLSYLIPRKIVIVSKKAMSIYEKIGYDKKKLVFIPNGYDLLFLKLDSDKRKIFITKNILENKKFIIGNVSRYDPKKDHSNLLNALSILRNKKIKFFCILAGKNIDKSNLKLNREISKFKLNKHIKLLGQINNILEFMNGIDVYVQSSSYGEGFPNVVAEAMACETPCIVTDVGDASLLVGNTGWIVPPNDPIHMANALEKSFYESDSIKWNQRSNKVRSKISNNFDISIMIKNYNKLWANVYKTKY